MWRRASAVLLVACACGSHDAPDASSIDAGSDAHITDSALDSARDASSADAGADGPDATLPAGWRYVSGSFPPTARLAFAEPSLVASTSFAEESCPDRPGCRRIVQTWPSGFCAGVPLPCSPFSVGEAGGEYDGTRGTLVIGRQTEAGTAEGWAIDDRGQALAGFRGAATVGTANIQNAAMALEVYAETSTDAQQFVLVVPLASPFSFLDLGEIDHLTPTLDVMQRFLLGDGAVAGEMTSLVIQRIPLDGSAPTIVSGDEGTLGAIVGQTIFFDHFTSPPGDIRVARPGEPAEVLIAGPQAETLRIATDGHDLAWLGYDLDGTGMATNWGVWTAPYVEHAAELVPRRIDSPAGASFTTPIRVGHGYAAVATGAGDLRIYRLADQYHADLARPLGELWFAPAYVGPTEIAVAAHGADRTYATQLCFIELASLDWVPTP